MDNLERLFDTIDACNGEIRLQAVRYGGFGGNWYCLVIISEQNDIVDEKFSDLIGGDNDYFDASEFFERNQEDFILRVGYSPQEAFDKATNDAAEVLDKRLKDAGVI